MTRALNSFWSFRNPGGSEGSVNEIPAVGARNARRPKLNDAGCGVNRSAMVCWRGIDRSPLGLLGGLSSGEIVEDLRSKTAFRRTLLAGGPEG
jgi:hypothetical protein